MIRITGIALLRRAAIVGAIVLFGVAGTASAQSEVRGTWLAAAAASPTDATTWGRLTLKHGMLAFKSSQEEWHATVADITRVEDSASGDRVFEIETRNGDILYVSILGPQMMTESPGKAMKTIKRAMQSATNAAPARTTATAAGGGTSQKF